MELDINNISIAHIKGTTKIIKVFDNPKECLKFCDDVKSVGAELSADPLYKLLHMAKIEENIESDKLLLSN